MPEQDSDDRSYRPGWLVATPFLGTPPALTRRQWNVIGLLTGATAFAPDARTFVVLQFLARTFAVALEEISGEV
jgi:hypothetical protein